MSKILTALALIAIAVLTALGYAECKSVMHQMFVALEAIMYLLLVMVLNFSFRKEK